MLTKTLHIILMLLASSCAWALDVKEFTFSHIGVHEGIVNQRVFSLVKTTDGAVWWTTKCDVGRTNGARVTNYRLNKSNSYSGLGGRVVKFASYSNPAMQDSLLVYDDKGRIYHYLRNQNCFEFRYDIEKYIGSEIVVEDLLATDNGMFLAMREGLYYVSMTNPKPVQIIKGLYCNAIIPVKGEKGELLNGQVLIATNKGLLLVELGKKDTIKKKRFIYSGYVDSGYYDYQTGELWIGTLDSGVKKAPLRLPRGGETSLLWADVAGVPHNPVRALTPYGKTMLIGIDGYGVYQCPRKGNNSLPFGGGQGRGASLLFNANEGRQGVLHGNGVYSILVDKWNNIEIGSYSGGIDIARPVGSTTAIFQHVVNSTQCINNDHVNCVEQTDADHLLMGTDNGLSIFDSKNSTWQNVAKNIVVLDICKSPSGKLLLATYGNGVCEVGPDGTAHTIYSKSNGVLKDDHVYSLLYDRQGNLWIGCLFGKLTEVSATGTRYYDIDNVQVIKELPDFSSKDNGSRIAVGTANGVFLLRHGDSAVKRLEYSVPSHSTDANRYVLDLYADSSGRLCIATDGGGVYVYNLKDGKCFQITTSNGLPSNSVHSIIKDRTGRIWFGTEKGLAFAYQRDLRKVVDVNYCNGVRSEYIRGAACNLIAGHMLFGTIDGARIVDPQHLQELNYTAPLMLLRVECADVDSSGVHLFNDQVAEMLSKGKLKLGYGQRSFELYFESVNMRNHFDIAYQYKMDNGEWSEPDEDEFIRFVNLEPGKHHLTIRCVSQTGGTVLDTKELTIVISQPWWNSWWMWIIYIVVLAGAFYGAWRVYDLQARYYRLVMDKVNEAPLCPAGISPKGENNMLVQEEVSAPSHLEPSTIDKVSSQGEGREEGLEAAEFVNKATKIVLDNLKDTDFTIDTLCREIAMSRTLFYVKVKSYTGKSPQEFVRMIRLERAAALLKQGRSVGDVAMLTGFDNPKYFSVVFKKYFSVSPSQYKS